MKSIAIGELTLDESTAHYVRDVLRLETGTALDLFDATGTTAEGKVITCHSGQVVVRVEKMTAAAAQGSTITVASAIPKANRADWMIEKLSELGMDRFIPLQTARSVVHPDGKNKIERWKRLAAEAARQSRRLGVMNVQTLTQVGDLVTELTHDTSATGWYCSTAAHAKPMLSLLSHPLPDQLTLLIGPEGGWTPEELAMFDASGFLAVGLTDTVLRIETAACTVAAVVAVVRPRNDVSPV